VHVALEGSTWVNPRGYGRFTREFIRALLRAASPHRFTLVLDSGAAAATDLPDVPRIVAATRKSVVSAAAADGARSPQDLWRMGAALSGREFDAVVFPTLYSYVPVVSRAHVTVVVHDAMPETVPDLVLGSRRARLLWKAKTWLACRRANAVATVSEASASEIRRHLPLSAAADVVVLTEGVDQVFTAVPSSRDAVSRAPWTGGEAPYVLYVGGLSPHKRVAPLVQAFGRLANDPTHETLRLLLTGPGEIDTFRADDRGLAVALDGLGPARPRVVHTGYVPDEALAALYRGAACVVLPSIVEGFGLPALEAMACGAPVLAARTPALEEVCADAADYFDRIEDLPARLAHLMSDHTRRAMLREAGPLRARHFSWDEAARRWLAAMERSRQGRPC
jgi:glycosyltransferase involved in cell wall biosynthesis